jgi:hypothetical protein
MAWTDDVQGWPVNIHDCQALHQVVLQTLLVDVANVIVDQGCLWLGICQVLSHPPLN